MQQQPNRKNTGGTSRPAQPNDNKKKFGNQNSSRPPAKKYGAASRGRQSGTKYGSRERDERAQAGEQKRKALLEETLIVTYRGSGFVIDPDSKTGDKIEIPHENLSGALNGDTVLVRRYKAKDRWSGEVR